MQRGTYRIIPVKAKTHTVFALVSPEDYEALAAHRWFLHSNGYAVRNSGGRKNYRQVRMHREILGLVRDDGTECDHINRDRLDNRRTNLRAVTHAVNGRNVSSHSGSTSRFRGVSWMPKEQLWRARARLGKRAHSLGTYRSERRAGAAVNDFWTAHGYAPPNDLAA